MFVDNKPLHLVSLWRGSSPFGDFCIFFSFLWPRISGWNSAPEESQFLVGKTPNSVSIAQFRGPLLMGDPKRSDMGIHFPGEMQSHCWDILIQAGEVVWMAPHFVWTAWFSPLFCPVIFHSFKFRRKRSGGGEVWRETRKEEKKKERRFVSLSSTIHTILKQKWQRKLKGSFPSSNAVCHHLMNKEFILSLLGWSPMPNILACSWVYYPNNIHLLTGTFFCG